MNALSVRFYPDGDRGPVKEYFEKLLEQGHTRKALARIVRDIQVVASEGLRTPQASVRSLGNQLWEIRRPYLGIQYRIIFAVKGTEMWLLHAFEKKTGKTPDNDLRLALNRWSNHLNQQVNK